MAKRKGSSSASGPRTRSTADEEGRKAREAESTQGLDKLPPEVWEKVFDHLEENDLFPLALSCKYFRQKQKELVARPRQKGKPRLALKTNSTLKRWPVEGLPASADYLRFCSKEKVSRDDEEKKDKYIRCLAAFHGHLPLLQELLKPLNMLDQEITRAAAIGGQLETLQWLRTQEGFNLDEWVFASACNGGHFEMLRWLRSVGCPWSENACRAAAFGGHLETLKWLRSEGCPWDEEACRYAANSGHLEILKWLKSEGCPWDTSTCAFAAKGGRLEILKWLRSEGCPWDESTCTRAAEGGNMVTWSLGLHLDVLKWAIDNGCPYEVDDVTRPALESLGLA